MSSTLFGGGERPPSPPDRVNKPSPPSTASPTLAPPTPAPDLKGPCTLHSSCQPTQVEIDRRGDLILIVGDDSCALQKVSESGEAEQSEHLPEKLVYEQRTERELVPEPAPELAPPEEPAPEEPEPEPEEPEREMQKPIAFRVCSRTMARAASPFDAMLYRGFKESIKPEPTKTEPTRKGSEWIVRLPDDDPWVMKLLLPVIHGCFSEFDPHTLEGTRGLGNLYRVTVLTDKYDTTQILRPWASRLVQSLKESVEQLNGLDLEKALWVSWILGSKTVLKLVVNRLIWRQPRRAFSVLAPPGAEETIRDLRLDIITALLRPIKDTIEASISQQETPCHGIYCSVTPHPTSMCNLVILGSLMQSLGAIGMWPLPSAKDWDGTAAELQETIFTKIVIRVKEGHSWCLSMEIRGSDDQVSWYPEIKVAFEMKGEYLTLQARKLGLKDD